jgi:uncharacterized protein
MKHLLVALLCLVCSAPALAQSGDEPATRDDVILYFRTMHSFDMMQKVVRVQMEAMQQLGREQLVKAGKLPANYDEPAKKTLDEALKAMPFDEITEAMIPTYQKHFTRSDVQAMNAFYSSPVGQKVLQELPAVMQDGLQDAMPILNKYVSDFKERMKSETGQTKKITPGSDPGAAPAQ